MSMGAYHLPPYVYPVNKFWPWIGEQNGPLSGSLPLILHAVNSFDGIPGTVALAVARSSNLASAYPFRNVLAKTFDKFEAV